MNPFEVGGQRVLVTGATRGIGRGIARAFADAGAETILVGRDEKQLRSVEQELRASGRRAQAAVFDLRNTDGIAGWFEELCDQMGTPDVLVNAAGISRRGMAVDLTLEDWHEVMAVNATALFELSRSFARRRIKEGGGGSVIHIASLMTAAARAGTAPYTASKGAVGQLTKVLAVEWAKHGIRVNAVAPGYIATDLNRSLLADAEFDRWVKQRCPMGRWGTPEDIAWPVVFLASPASGFINGQVLFVDGGWLATF